MYPHIRTYSTGDRDINFSVLHINGPVLFIQCLDCLALLGLSNSTQISEVAVALLNFTSSLRSSAIHFLLVVSPAALLLAVLGYLPIALIILMSLGVFDVLKVFALGD